MVANSFIIVHTLFLCLVKSGPLELDWGLEISEEAEGQVSQGQDLSLDSVC